MTACRSFAIIRKMANANLGPHERLILGAVILGGIAALIFAFPYMGKRIGAPYAPKGTATFKTLEEQEAEKEAALRIQDTDRDGLVDYDEIYVWKTSAYLADSDSDGFDDKTEIDSGNDPNCPRGKECGGVLVKQPEAEGPGTATSNELVPSDVQTFLPGNAGSQTSGATNIQQMLDKLGSLSPDDLRKLLIEQGASRETIDALSDEKLMQFYKEAFGEALKQAREQDKSSTPSP